MQCQERPARRRERAAAAHPVPHDTCVIPLLDWLQPPPPQDLQHACMAFRRRSHHTTGRRVVPVRPKNGLAREPPAVPERARPGAISAGQLPRASSPPASWHRAAATPCGVSQPGRLGLRPGLRYLAGCRRLHGGRPTGRRERRGHFAVRLHLRELRLKRLAALHQGAALVDGGVEHEACAAHQRGHHHALCHVSHAARHRCCASLDGASPLLFAAPRR
eukprot:CAMPEP_0202036300 /NCGR_PEP_ID=MMETSP0962-20130828/1451_1 /ASSEMBLY_ACC=CAM_ASM_000488 /TAXON_ID=4773 /ORGANISM="Schizochytrium aggregatum, Strain ATCC28209" /LENGTH=218 /DNA_ID=CAMNT_0048600371 /DNA_START=585 /DNA_END=1237 /DNA_ORIENTATION=-